PRTEPATHLSLSPQEQSMAAAASICPVRASPATRWTPTDSPRLPLPFPPIYFIRRRQKRRHHSILAPPDSGPVGLPPAAAATTSPCLHPSPAQPHARGVQPRASGVCGFTGAARSHGSAVNGVD
uniref:Uncharacterized protein n=1 Tax=Aegilops tauschii subsp. strangulata TaxID=200361 RepID=A0A453G7K5_AEGTS